MAQTGFPFCVQPCASLLEPIALTVPVRRGGNRPRRRLLLLVGGFPLGKGERGEPSGAPLL